MREEQLGMLYDALGPYTQPVLAMTGQTVTVIHLDALAESAIGIEGAKVEHLYTHFDHHPYTEITLPPDDWSNFTISFRYHGHHGKEGMGLVIWVPLEEGE